MDSSFDVVIIGGGIVGSSAAYFLSKAGQRVAMVEKGRIAGEQSSRNWGAVRVQGRHRAEVPIMLDSLEIWKELKTELGECVNFTQQGQMLVAYGHKQLAGFEETLTVAKEFGIPSRILTPGEIHDLLPHYRSETCVGALFNPLDGCAEPELAAPAIARGAAR